MKSTAEQPALDRNDCNACDIRANRILIVGCGRSHRRDDQAGLLIARRLADSLPAQSRVQTCESGGADLLTDVDGVELLIIVDAACADNVMVPGQWRRIQMVASDMADDALSAIDLGLSGDMSSHLLGVIDALRMGSHLDILPSNIWIYAVAGADFGYGDELTECVARIVSALADKVRSDIGSWLRAQEPGYA